MIGSRLNPGAPATGGGEKASPSKRGRLKVFLGACTGVGKTYSMLAAAQRLRRHHGDVLVGVVDSHGRPETDALLEGLESLPLRWIENRGAKLREFDLEAALARRPGVILIDDLAHSNSPGSAHAKRWQDVRALLDAGVSVFTTVNIQHLESQNDLVARITRVAARETVPDSLLEEADDVELVDLPPDELLQRLGEGKVYGAEPAGEARENFFRKGTLIALRQLALRYTAERVDRQMQAYRRDQEIGHAWPGAERLIVCVGPSPQSANVVRAAKRLAMRLHAELIAVYVETPAVASQPPADRERVLETLHLAEQLGAETATLTGDDLTDVLLRYARERNASKIVVGKPASRSWRNWVYGSPVDRLARQSGEVDLYVIKGAEQDGGRTEPTPARPVAWRRYAGTLGVVVFCTILCGSLLRHLAEANRVMIYLCGVVFVATRFGRGPAVLASILSVLSFDYFFVPPYLTFTVADSQSLLTFGTMLAVGLVVSTLAVRTRQQAESATDRERRTAALYSMSRELASSQGKEELAAVALRHVEDVFHGRAALYLPEPDARVEPVTTAAIHPLDERGVAQWVYDHKQNAGLGTPTLQASQSINVPLTVGDRVIGVLGFAPGDPAGFLVPQQIQLLETFATQAAVALERDRLALQAAKSRIQVEAEKLRNTLLSSISHDLRTPLASIKGATTLLLSSPNVDPGVRLDLLRSIQEEVEYINRTVTNLLNLTRLESGHVEIQKEPHPLEEIVGAVADLLEKGLQEHPLRIVLPPDLPMIPMDGSLIQQLVFNLLDNALNHTTSGTPMELSARVEGGAVLVEVADRGPGIRPGEERKIFDKFYRVTAEGKRSGMGLGLALCEAIVRLHGGRIWAENHPKGGAVFRFTLPLEPRGPETPP
ncbi:MAG TPA: sensor histidine kinase KdpD [Planctomycetota bacterium]|nr:sensor histidine kinase KdpD [Planctomycetota bacterium]